MQPVVEPVRSHLTPAQVVAIIQDAEGVRLSGGLELVTLDLTVLDDISDFLLGGTVERQSYADLHGSFTFRLNQKLDWGADLVRPYLVMSDGTNTARFNMGVYMPNTPAHPLDEDTPVFDVTGHDILLRLRQKVGDAYGIAAGTNYLTEVEQILQGQGITQYVIDPTAANVVAPTSRAWAFDGELTWLALVNDLLGSIGYQGVYSDWDGRIRCHAYQLPIERPAEWTYTMDKPTTLLGREKSIEHDFFEAPNRWVVYRSNMAEGSTPTEGDGIYTFTNQSNGETSVDARNGLVQTRVESRDVADQAALVAETLKLVAADMEIPTVVNVPVAPMPLHWHFDRMLWLGGAPVASADVMCTRWTMPIPPESGDMQQEWRVLA